MKKSFVSRLLFVAATLTLVPCALSACSSTQDALPPYWKSKNPPPATRLEVTPDLNPQTQIWIPGYWALTDGQFTWVAGKIIPRPDPTAVWAPAHWAHHTYGWGFETGHWE